MAQSEIIVPDSQPGSSQQATLDRIADMRGAPPELDVDTPDDEPSGSKAGYSVLVRGKKLAGNQVRNRIVEPPDEAIQSLEESRFETAAEAAAEAAVLGYAWMDIISPDQAMLPGYINGRPVNVGEADTLRKSMRATVCKPAEHPMIAAVEVVDCFVDLEGNPLAIAKSPSEAQQAKLKAGAVAWRIAGGHRTAAVVKEWRLVRAMIEDREELTSAMDDASVKRSAQAVEDLELLGLTLDRLRAWKVKVDTVWRWWLVKIYFKPTLDQNTKAMARVRMSLGDNRKIHQYEGGPREAFHMVQLAPETASWRLAQHTSRLWKSAAFQVVLSVWLLFANLPDVESLQIVANSGRIYEPWFGAFCLLVADAFQRVADLLQPAEGAREDAFVTTTYYSIFDATIHGIFETTFEATLLPILRKELICDDNGNASNQWITAFQTYLAKVLLSLNGLQTTITQSPTVQPPAWPEHRKDALLKLIGGIKASNATIRDHVSRSDPVPLSNALPFFCESLGQAYMQLARQCGPAIAVLAEIVEPAWRNFRHSGNREDHELPDETLLLRFQAQKRVGNAADVTGLWGSFFLRLIFADWGTALSARVVDLGLRSFDSHEPQSIAVPPVSLKKSIQAPSEPQKGKGKRKPPALSTIQNNAFNYVRGKMGQYLINTGRQDIQQSTRDTWQGYLSTAAPYQTNLPPGFDDWLNQIFTSNSYFSEIAHAVPITLENHVDPLFSVFSFLRDTQANRLSALVPTPEFRMVWNAWAGFSEAGGIAESVWYHAFVDVDQQAPQGCSPIRTHGFRLCFVDGSLPTLDAAQVTEADRKAAQAQDRRARPKRTRGKRGTKADDAQSAEETGVDGDIELLEDDDEGAGDIDEAQSNDGSQQASVRGKGKGKAADAPPSQPGSRSKRKRGSEPDATSLPASKKGASGVQQPSRPTLSKPKIEDSDNEVALATFRQSNDSAERHCGYSLESLDEVLNDPDPDVMRLHDGFNACLFQYATRGLPPDLAFLVIGLRWSVLGAVAANGKSTHVYWLPPVEKTLDATWTDLIKQFNQENGTTRFAPHDPIHWAGTKPLSLVGYLPINVLALRNLRMVTQSVLAQWSTAKTLPTLVTVSRALVSALQENWKDCQTTSQAAAANAIDVDMKIDDGESGTSNGKGDPRRGDDDHMSSSLSKPSSGTDAPLAKTSMSLKRQGPDTRSRARADGNAEKVVGTVKQGQSRKGAKQAQATSAGQSTPPTIHASTTGDESVIIVRHPGGGIVNAGMNKGDVDNVVLHPHRQEGHRRGPLALGIETTGGVFTKIHPPQHCQRLLRDSHSQRRLRRVPLGSVADRHTQTARLGATLLPPAALERPRILLNPPTKKEVDRASGANPPLPAIHDLNLPQTNLWHSKFDGENTGDRGPNVGEFLAELDDVIGTSVDDQGQLEARAAAVENLYRQVSSRPSGNSSPASHDAVVNGVAVMRRRSDGWLNATQILKVAGFDKPQRTRVLEREVQKGEHEKVQGCYGKYQGGDLGSSGVPLDRGLWLAKQNNIGHFIQPIVDFAPQTSSPPLAPRHLPPAPVKPKKKINTTGEGGSIATRSAKRGDQPSHPATEVGEDDGEADATGEDDGFSEMVGEGGSRDSSPQASEDGSMTTSPSDASSSSRAPSPYHSPADGPSRGNGVLEPQDSMDWSAASRASASGTQATGTGLKLGAGQAYSQTGSYGNSQPTFGFQQPFQLSFQQPFQTGRVPDNQTTYGDIILEFS
ncbi:hypothetical protein FRC01_006339, partial [Tulasnella sp. 417]